MIVVRKMSRGAMVAALYVVLCVVFQPISFGSVQVRVAEALCLLPVFGAEYIAAVTLGCFLSNLLFSVWQDVVFGTLATFLACLGTWALRRLRVRGLALPAAVPPVLSNMLIVGPVVALYFDPNPATLPVILFNMISVGVGEVIACMGLGVALTAMIERNAALRRALRL